MKRVVVRRSIDAPREAVFRTVTDVEGLPDRDPAVSRVEFLSERRSGPGTRFREARVQGKRESVTELEITEYRENEYARFVSDAGGTVWDTVFAVRSALGGGTELEITLDARPHRLLSRIMLPFVMGMVRRGMDKHIESLKRYCESLPE